MKTKYYTPSLTEFSDGFIFEKKINNKWQEVSFCFLELGEELKNIRVKELDEEDIKSLNFELKEVNDNCRVFFKMHPSLSINKSIELTVNLKTKLITILIGKETVVNDIKILNKSELIWLLKRLYIYE